MTSQILSAPSSPIQGHNHRQMSQKSHYSPPPAAVQAAASPVFSARASNDRPAHSPVRPAFQHRPPPPSTPMKRSAPGQRALTTRALAFGSPSTSFSISSAPVTSSHLASLPPRPAAPGNLIAPNGLALERSAKKARKEALKQIQDLEPFFFEFPELLQNARFLGNGGESAVFLKDNSVIKIPITDSLRIHSHIRAQEAVETTEQNYQALAPIFAPLTSIKLTSTAFCQTDDGSFYVKQPHFPRAIDCDALTPAMLQELRQLLLSGIRADLRPSNFGVDEQGHLQFFDFNMPESEQLYLKEMTRAWNEVTPELGTLLIEQNDQMFEAYACKFINRPKTINNKNLTATVAQELRQFIFSNHFPQPTPSTVGIDKNGHVQFFNRISVEDDILSMDELSHCWDDVGVNLGQLLTEENNRLFASKLATIFPDREEAAAL